MRGRREDGRNARWLWGRMGLVWGCAMLPATAVAQPPSYTTWEAGGVVWCGIEDDWTWSLAADGMAIHELDASGSDTRLLWGCATSWPTNVLDLDSGRHAAVHWHQGVSGSNANRSAVLWAEAPSADPTEAVSILMESHLAGWLDNTGGVAAGMHGNEDPLGCHAPGLAPWEVSPSCHEWAAPFAFQGSWSWSPNGHWKASAHDFRRRSDTWVDTTFFTTFTQPICLGMDITHTSSQGDQWAFGWMPLTDPTTLGPDSSEIDLELVNDVLVRGTTWPLNAEPQDVQIRQMCLGAGMPPTWSTAQPTSCDNVWQWTLPCPLEPGSSATLFCEQWSQSVWSDGTALLSPGQLCFTEIMADPTPAIHAPESTYLEVLNDSPWAIRPEDLRLMDSNEPHMLNWLTRPEGSFLLPGERMLLVDQTSPWMSSPWSDLNVLRVSGWSGLRDEGETLRLETAEGMVLERLTFWDTWWGDVAQDGQSLSILHPNACDHPDTWSADPVGASPGRPSALEEAPAEIQVPEFGIRQRPNGSVAVSVHPAMHLDQIPWIQWSTSDTSGGAWLTWNWNDMGQPEWTFPWPLKGTQHVALHCEGLEWCLPQQPSFTLDTLWVAHRPPEMGDIQLTEILPVTHPILDAEFVEWTNVSQDTLSWGRHDWVPGTALVQSSKPRSRYMAWLSADNLPGIWEVHPNMSLTNAEGHVSLKDPWGNVVAFSTYSECGHDRRQGTIEGRSLEQHPLPLNFNQEGRCGGSQFWRTNPDEHGMSPGVISHWDWQEIDRAESPSWGVLDGHWVMTVPQGSEWRLWSPELWVPETSWTPLWHRGVLLAQSPLGPALSEHGPRHLTQPQLSFPISSPDHLQLPRTVPSWNEVLPDAEEGFGTFVEWATPAGSDWTRDYAWSSDRWAQPGDFQVISELTWWLPGDTTVCLAHCPTWVSGNDEGCLAADVPSLHGDPWLQLRTPSGISEVDLATLEASAWVMQKSGVSMARIPSTSVWTSTPPPELATPGRPNGHAHQGGDEEEMSLLCAPRTLQPGGVSSWDKVRLEWAPKGGGAEDVFALSYGILNPHSMDVVQRHEANWAGTTHFHWIWDATNEGQLVLPGGYIGWISWQNLTTQTRGTEKCIIGVAPP